MTLELTRQSNVEQIPENLAHIKTVIRDMEIFANSLPSDNEPAFLKLTSLYCQAREWIKEVEVVRKKRVDPLRKEMAAINDKAKEITEPLNKVIEIANHKTSLYQKMLEDSKRLEDEKMRAAAKIFDFEDDIYIPPVEKNMRGDGAMTVTKTEKKFRLSDLSKVPLKYLMVDEKTVERDLKLGIEVIPGLEVYEETTTSLRKR